MRILKFFTGFLLVLIIVFAVLGLWLSDKYVVPIMMYHHVDYTDQFKPMVTSPELFNWQMDFLKKHGYNVISLDGLVTAIKQGKRLPRNSVVVTFDDGYIDNYTRAFDILKEYQIPVTFFVSSHLIGQEHYLTWDQLSEMQRHGVTVASHSRRHDYLPYLTENEQRDEAMISKQVLEEQLDHPVGYFAYPSGGFTETLKRTLKEAGYKGACTTNRGNDRLNKDVYQLNRIRFSDRDNSTMIMRAKLSGYYNLFRKLKPPYQVPENDAQRKAPGDLYAE